jgi:hypothetical protein
MVNELVGLSKGSAKEFLKRNALDSRASSRFAFFALSRSHNESETAAIKMKKHKLATNLE